MLRLWKEKRIFGLFLDSRIIKANKIEKVITRQLETFGSKKENVGWIIFDNWDLNNKDAKQILTYIKKEYEDVLDMFKLYEFPVTVSGINADDVVKVSKSDKKMDAGKIKFILLNSIGNAYIDYDVSDMEMKEALKSVLN